MSTKATSRSTATKAVVAMVLLLGTSLGVAMSFVTAADAASTSPVTATFTINGRQANHSSASNPIKLDPTHPAQVSMSVTNNGSAPVTVGTIALSGRALDITFFDFETQTALQVPPGSTQSQQFTLDFAPLNGQGDGLIPATVRILDPQRKVLAGQKFTADVRGRITSLFGLFAIEVTVFTLILFAGAFLGLARGTLHSNRFRRALRFLWPAIGLGLVIVFSFAILRVWVPSPGRWLPIVLICAIAGFVVGYLTPHPALDDYGSEPDPEPEAGAGAPAADPHVTLTAAGAPARPTPTGE